MSRQIQIRRGTTDEHEDFIGAIGEITMDTEQNTLRIHDGKTPGGIPLARANDIPDISEIISKIEEMGDNTSTLPDDIDYVTEYASGLTGTNYTNGWYRKYKSGWIEQGGLLNPNAGTTNITVPLIIEMADTNYSGTLTSLVNYSGTSITPPIFRTVATNSFLMNKIASDRAVFWRICGFVAE